jgi:hypothetical protein
MTKPRNAGGTSRARTRARATVPAAMLSSTEPPAGVKPEVWIEFGKFTKRLSDLRLVSTPALGNITVAVMYMLRAVATEGDQERALPVFQAVTAAPDEAYQRLVEHWIMLEEFARPNDKLDSVHRVLHFKCIYGHLTPLLEELANPSGPPGAT